MEFSSPEALKKYLQKYPGADRSKHTVKNMPNHEVAEHLNPGLKKKREERSQKYKRLEDHGLHKFQLALGADSYAHPNLAKVIKQVENGDEKGVSKEDKAKAKSELDKWKKSKADNPAFTKSDYEGMEKYLSK